MQRALPWHKLCARKQNEIIIGISVVMATLVVGISAIILN